MLGKIVGNENLSYLRMSSLYDRRLRLYFHALQHNLLSITISLVRQDLNL